MEPRPGAVCLLREAALVALLVLTHRWRAVATALTMNTAFSLAAFRIAEICRAATGSADQMADFLMMDPPENVGKRGRLTAVVGKDGSVQTFPSIAALARAAGLARQTVSRAIHRGVPGRGRLSCK